MKTIKIKSKQRKDGKYQVTYIYAGEPNMFGGHYPAKVFNKLHTAEQIRSHQLYSGDTFINDSGEPDDVFQDKIPDDIIRQ